MARVNKVRQAVVGLYLINAHYLSPNRIDTPEAEPLTNREYEAVINAATGKTRASGSCGGLVWRFVTRQH